jgi:hypothetical protein
MTKAKARERAKANAVKKAKRRAAQSAQPGQIPPGQFDPGSGSIKSPRFNANAPRVGTGKRGSARSR